MRTVILSGSIAVAGLFCAGVSGCTTTVTTSEGGTEVEVDVEPPAPRVEVRPSRPGPDHDWVDGHWTRRGREWVWTSGHWTARPRGHSGGWVPGHWDKRGRRWVWVEGHWR